jgi:hypothetical protein
MKRNKPDFKLSLLELQLEEFEAYLLSSQLYWPLSMHKSAGAESLRLTTGNLFLNINDISAGLEQLSEVQKQDFYTLMNVWNRMHRTWLSTMQKKALLELSSRINLWSAYLIELKDNKNLAEHYKVEIRNRVICSLLAELTGNISETTSIYREITLLDQQLNQMFQQGPFIWAEYLKEIYPKDEFWFLYGLPITE